MWWTCTVIRRILRAQPMQWTTWLCVSVPWLQEQVTSLLCAIWHWHIPRRSFLALVCSPPSSFYPCCSYWLLLLVHYLVRYARLYAAVGYHPWFAHWISTGTDVSKGDHYRSLFLDSPKPKEKTVSAFNALLPLLPDPIPLASVLDELRENLTEFPEAMLGEVGLDRICRIPYLTPSLPPYNLHDGPRALSPFTIPVAHQVAILEAQLDLAVELRRNVSLHSVKSQEATVKLFDKMKEKHKDRWADISVDLHSCGLSVETLKIIQVSLGNRLLQVNELATYCLICRGSIRTSSCRSQP